jgi:hypothetical protein
LPALSQKGQSEKSDWPFPLPTRPTTLDTRELGKTPNTIGIAMPSKESDAGRPVYVRLLLLLVGEAIAGLALLRYLRVYADGSANGNCSDEFCDRSDRYHFLP